MLLFNSLGTQWRTGAAGIIGLDYSVLYHKLDRMKLSESEYDDLEADVRTMESSALETMRAG